MKNIKTTLLLLLISFNLFSQEAIKMKKVNGTYQIPCKVNGVPMNFVFDTGASDVSISLTEAEYLIKNNLLTEEDFIKKTSYKIADGSIIEGTQIVLKSLQIGNTIIKNVKASIIHNSKAPLLLGQSAINRLGKYSIDNDKLIIENAPISNQELDKKYGYKNIKFDTHISEYNNLQKLGGDTSIIFYLHKPKNQKKLLTLFGTRFNGIVLGFNNQKKLDQIVLIKIYDISTSKKSDMKYMMSDMTNIVYSFSSVLGRPDENENDDEKLNYSYIWYNNKTMLSVSLKSREIKMDDSYKASWRFEKNVIFSKKVKRSISDF